MSSKNKDEVLRDIKAHPENHQHNFMGLQQCCTIDNAINLELMEAHSKFASTGTNGGVECDVTEGPCACGAWH